MNSTKLSPDNYKKLFTAIVGSRAHGTETPTSDYDTRYVMVVPTSELLSLEYSNKFKREPVGVKDENFWELQHFMHLCLKGNPSTLEVLLAPTEFTTPEGEELRALHPKLLQRTKVYDAHRGFARSQMHQLAKTENTHDFNKAAAHYLRVLYNGIELLRNGRMTVRITDTPLGETVLRAKRGELSIAEIYALGQELQKEMDEAYANSTLPEEANLAELNEFLLRMRKQNW